MLSASGVGPWRYGAGESECSLSCQCGFYSELMDVLDVIFSIPKLCTKITSSLFLFGTGYIPFGTPIVSIVTSLPALRAPRGALF